MVDIVRSSGERGSDAGQFDAPMPSTAAFDRSAARTDIGLLVSSLFLPRFTLPVGKTFLKLDLLPIYFIVLYQFIRGNIVIQYDRFLWFLCLGLMTTISLLLNFNSNMLIGWGDFVLFYFMLAFRRSSTLDQYRQTLHAFQFLVAFLSSIGIVQFAAQFVIDGRQLIHFYGLVPEFLLSDTGVNFVRFANNGLIEASGLFLPEPSFLGQYAALGILIEILEFRRLRYLVIMILGLLLSYSGTGVMLLLLFLPPIVRRSKAGMGAMAFVAILIIGLIATGAVDLSNFTSRVGEFNETDSSGWIRFVAPFVEASQVVASGNVQATLLGHGPGTLKTTYSLSWRIATDSILFKIFYEYGIIGSFVFACFLLSCVRGTRCPRILIAAIIFSFVFLNGGLLEAIPLCTLNGLPESGRRPFRPARAIPEIARDDRRGQSAPAQIMGEHS